MKLVFQKSSTIKVLNTWIERVAIVFSLGEYVLHQKTGHIGKVVGYGHEILNDVYTTTLKVIVDSVGDSRKQGIVEEDLYSARVPSFLSLRAEKQ